MQAIWLLARGHTIGATAKVTTFGSRWIEQTLERYNASGPDALVDGHRRNGLKPLFAGLLKVFAEAVGAGPTKRVVLLLDNAGFHTRPNLAVPGGIRLVHLPPRSPERQPARTLWPLVDEPILNKRVPRLDNLVNTIGARCDDLAKRQAEISSRTNFAWRPKKSDPS